jgi:prefoldin subunit 5
MDETLEFEELEETLTVDVPQNENKVTSADKVTEELNAYKRHFEALQADLMEIEQKYHDESKAADSALEKRVSGIEKNMQEIKELLQKQTQPQIPQYQPQFPPIPQYQPMPMYSPSAPIMPPVVTMPYGR